MLQSKDPARETVVTVWLLIYRQIISMSLILPLQAGFFTEYQPGDLIRWEDISQSTIEEDGRWNTTWGDLGTYSQSRLDAFICDGFFALWQDLEYCENSNKPEGPSDSEAKRIYQLRLWEETSGAVFKVEIKEKQDMGVGM